MGPEQLSFSVIGGDTRLIYTADKLLASGCDVCLTGMELYDPAPAAEQSVLSEALQRDVLIFGLPFSKNGVVLNAPFSSSSIRIEDIGRQLHKRQTVFAGMLSPADRLSLTSCGASVYDYFEDEALTLYNAMLTAEALAGLLIRKLPCSLFGAEIAITGYGRIGFYLARILRLLGARVTVFTRNQSQLAKARTLGLAAAPLKDLQNTGHTFRALVNTVPAQILQKERLQLLNRDCLLVEAAAAPYGIDRASAESIGIPVYLASGLPGKYAPESAGAFIADTVLKTLQEVKP